MRKLPTYKGYTVDERLKEFRKIEYGKLPEFLSFESTKGQQLLGGYKRQKSLRLLPKDIRAKLPPLYSQENVKDPMVICKFFTPDAHWTWYAIEFDGEDTFFGYVAGDDCELGYFSLSELTGNRGQLGMSIERDLHFTPQPLSKVRQLHE